MNAGLRCLPTATDYPYWTNSDCSHYDLPNTGARFSKDTDANFMMQVGEHHSNRSPRTMTVPRFIQGDDVGDAAGASCTGASRALYKDSMLSERSVQFRYTGTTEAVDSVVWTYSWQRRKVIIGLNTPFTHLYSSGQAYHRDTICVTVYSGCGIDRFCKYPPPLNVHGGAMNSNIRVTPNPASGGHFRLRLETSGMSDGPFSVRVRSLTGQLVYERMGTIANGRYSEEHVLPGVVPGIYVLSIESDSFRETLRLAVE